MAKVQAAERFPVLVDLAHRVVAPFTTKGGLDSDGGGGEFEQGLIHRQGVIMFKVQFGTMSMDYGLIWSDCFTAETYDECSNWLSSAPGDPADFRIIEVPQVNPR